MKVKSYEGTDFDEIHEKLMEDIEEEGVACVCGQWISCEEITHILVNHRSVAHALVNIAEDPEIGKSLIAYVVLTEGIIPSEGLKNELVNFVKSQTHPCLIFRNIEFVNYVPPYL